MMFQPITSKQTILECWQSPRELPASPGPHYYATVIQCAWIYYDESKL